MGLVWRDKSDPTVMMIKPVPAHESEAPVPGFLQGDESVHWIVRTVLAGPEHGLGVGIVVAHPRPAAGRGDPEFVERVQHGGAFHGASVVGVQDERLIFHVQSLGQHSLTDKVAGMFSGLLLPDLPAHDVAAEDVDDQVEIVIQPLDGTGEVRDVPGPDLVRGSGDKAGDSPFAGLLASATVIDLGCFMHDPVEA